jgi:hypothetical protein
MDGILALGTSPAEILAIGLIIAAKIAVPLLMLRFAFVAGWANFVLDSVDGDLLVPLGLANATYQPIDKLTDWLTYVVIVVLVYRTRWPIRRLMLGLFLFRSVGQAAFLVTGDELMLAYFPNLLEPLFLVTVTLMAWRRTVRARPDWRASTFVSLARWRWPIGIAIVGYKLVDEYFTHVGNIDRSDWLRAIFGG